MMEGFTFWLPTNGGTDYFVEATAKKRSKALAKRIMKAIGIEGNPEAFKLFLSRATCEIKEISTGREYYDIHGENFGGRGSWVDDGKTVILHL